jgi:hypothetical protein
LINLSFSGNPAHRLQQIAINFGSYPYLALTGDNHCKGGTVFRQTCWNIGNNLSSSDTKYDSMADAVFMYAVTAGIFVFLTAILFGSRAKRYSSGFNVGVEGGHKEAETS